ncbi:hypothetical protein, conserved [Eimeria praecox]|uniref:Uncharacterized protein n=1 Tax=Eimeria praecox TaxID=51316 RepID=U6G6I7_9EIME|nr:hypothetical protein, conserved [Eimeria praecox]
MLPKIFPEQKQILEKEEYGPSAQPIIFPNDTQLSEVTGAHHNGLRGTGTHKAQPRRPSRRHLGELVLASVISLVMTLALLALCHTPYKRDSLAGMTRRGLSWREAELSVILDECLELREELGISQRISAFDENLEGDPAARIARLAAMLSDSAAMFQQAEGFKHTAPPNNVSGSLYSTAGRTDQPAEDIGWLASLLSDPTPRLEEKANINWTELHWEPRQQSQMAVRPYNELAFRVEGPAPIVSTSAVEPLAHPMQRIAERSILQPYSKEMLPCISDNTRDLQNGGDQYHSSGCQQHSSTALHYARLPTTALCNLNAEGRLKEVESSSEGKCNSQEKQHIQIRHGAGAGEVTPSAAAPQVQLAEWGLLRNPEDHPFFHLPKPPQDAATRPFTAEFAFSGKLLQNSPMPMYLTMRELFSKQSLSEKEVDRILRSCELLVNYAIHRLTPALPRRTPFLVCRRLASLFMLFDYVVCTAQLVGAKMETERWWPRFVSFFRMDSSLLSPTRSSRLGSELLVDLAYRLIAALEIYRKGARPPPMEVIQLKRLIFSHLRSYSQFEHPSWNYWVLDDQEFMEGCDGLPRGIDLEQENRKLQAFSRMARFVQPQS